MLLKLRSSLFKTKIFTIKKSLTPNIEKKSSLTILAWRQASPAILITNLAWLFCKNDHSIALSHQAIKAYIFSLYNWATRAVAIITAHLFDCCDLGDCSIRAYNYKSDNIGVYYTVSKNIEGRKLF